MEFIRLIGIGTILGITLTGCGGGGGDSNQSNATSPNDNTSQTDTKPPVATAETITTQEDTGIAYSLKGSASNNGSLSYSITKAPSNGDYTLSDNNFTYTPNPDFFGTDEFTFEVKEGNLTASATIGLIVEAVNDAPVIESREASLNEDSSRSGQLTAVDVDNSSHTFEVTENPTNGTVTINSNGLYTYTPNEHFFGEDSFEYVAKDAESSSEPALVSFTVNSVNDAPEFATTEVATIVIAGESKLISTAAEDIEDTNLTYELKIDTPDGIELSLEQDTAGDIAVTSEYGSWGNILGSLTATDSEQASGTQNIKIDVQVPPSTAEIKGTILESECNDLVANTVIEHYGFLYQFVSACPEFNPETSSDGTNRHLVKSTLNGEFVEIIGLGTVLGGISDVAIGQHNDEILISSVFGAKYGPSSSGFSYTYFTTFNSTTGEFTNQRIDIPYSDTVKSLSYTVAFIETVGFVIQSNEGTVHIIDETGQLSSTLVPETGALIDTYSVDLIDIKLVDNTLYALNTVSDCSDEECTGGNTSSYFYTQLNLDSNELNLLELDVDAMHDGQVDEQGNVVIAHHDAITYFNTSGESIWSQPLEPSNLLKVSIAKGDVITSYSKANGTVGDDATYFVTQRINLNTGMVWNHEYRYEYVGSAWLMESITDEYGNVYLLFSDVAEHDEAGSYYSKFFVLHIDYSGQQQWLLPIEGETNKHFPHSVGRFIFTEAGHLVTSTADQSVMGTTSKLIQVAIER